MKESVVDTMMTASETTGGGPGSMVEAAKNAAVGTFNTVGSFAKANALFVGLGAFAVGIVAGIFIPRPKAEEEKVVPVPSGIQHRAVEGGEKLVQRARHMAEAMATMAGSRNGT
jgi:hypothetical protein